MKFFIQEILHLIVTAICTAAAVRRYQTTSPEGRATPGLRNPKWTPSFILKRINFNHNKHTNTK